MPGLKRIALTIEIPQSLALFWIMIILMICSVLFSLLWAFLMGGVQGASILGKLVLSVYSVVMTALMFKFGGLYEGFSHYAKFKLRKLKGFYY
jgi:hypothetical protein